LNVALIELHVRVDDRESELGLDLLVVLLIIMLGFGDFSVIVEDTCTGVADVLTERITAGHVAELGFGF